MEESKSTTTFFVFCESGGPSFASCRSPQDSVQSLMSWWGKSVMFLCIWSEFLWLCLILGKNLFQLELTKPVYFAENQQESQILRRWGQKNPNFCTTNCSWFTLQNFVQTFPHVRMIDLRAVCAGGQIFPLRIITLYSIQEYSERPVSETDAGFCLLIAHFIALILLLIYLRIGVLGINFKMRSVKLNGTRFLK